MRSGSPLRGPPPLCEPTLPMVLPLSTTRGWSGATTQADRASRHEDWGDFQSVEASPDVLEGGAVTVDPRHAGFDQQPALDQLREQRNLL